MSNYSDDLYDEAQEKLIAIILSNSDVVNTVTQEIKVSDFDSPQYSLLYGTILDLLHDSIPISEITVAERLESRGKLAQAGGVAFIASMRDKGDKYLLEAPVQVYISLLKSFATKNTLREQLSPVFDDLKVDSGVSGTQAISRVRDIVENLQHQIANKNNTSDMVDLVQDYKDRLHERALLVEQNKDMGGVIGIPTSLPTLTDITSGWKPGQFITVGARSSVGKSIFAVNQAVNSAKYGKSVLFFSLEMPREEIEDRIVSSVSGIPQWQLQKGSYNKQALQDALNDLKNMKISIDVSMETSMDSIRAKAIEQAQSEDGLDLLIIDYLQILNIPNPSGSREKDMATVSRQCKALAKEMNIPVIGVIQMNRAKTKEEAAEAPQDYNIRESNAFLTDSDILIILHRVDNGDASLAHTDITIAKHRNGQKGVTIKCSSNLSISLFTEVEMDKDMESVDDELGINLDDYNLDALDNIDFMNGDFVHE